MSQTPSSPSPEASAASSDPEILLGRLALHYKLATREQVQAALTARRAEGGLRGLAEILVDQGIMSPAHAERLRQIQRDMLAKERAAAAKPAAPAPSPPQPALAPEAPSPRREAAPTTAAVTAEQQAPQVPLLESVPERMDELLGRAMEMGASDIHIHSGAPLMVRLGGNLHPLTAKPLGPDRARLLIHQLLDEGQQATLEASGQVDFAYSLPGVGRYRANAYRQQRGVDAALRAIPPEPPTLEDLSLPESLDRLTSYHQGMVLFTGPGGCGKSSTMAALVDRINRERSDHIITVEDPIEYLYESRQCLVNQRQVGPHTESFARALRAALREDPDVIVIGELRDLETISLALTAAETGHLVLATLHTSNAIRTVNRLVGVFPPEQQAQIRTMVSESLRAVVSQRLVNRADGEGRVPALEVLIANKAVGNLIRENKTFQIRSVLQTGGNQGMCLLDASLQELVNQRVITRKEALRHAEERSRFEPKPATGATPAAGQETR